MEAQAAVVEPEQAHHRTHYAEVPKHRGSTSNRKARNASPARRRECPCTFASCRSSRRPRCDSWFSIFFGTSSPQPTMLTFGAHVSIIFPPHLVDEGCGHALRAWVSGCGFVHAACVLRISTATSGSPTNVIDSGFLSQPRSLGMS